MSRPINLVRGWPSPDVLPADLLAAACQRVLTQPAEYTHILQYGPDAVYQPLRDGLAEWLARHYGVEADAHRICITGGASQNLACILQSFTDPSYTRAAWIIEPCYHLICGIFEDAGFAGRLRGSPADDEGKDLEALETRIREMEEIACQASQKSLFKSPGLSRKLYRHVIYCVPTCSNPSGITMPLQRREGLVRLARALDALIVCDDVYDFLQWSLQGETRTEMTSEMRLPRLCDIDFQMGRAEGDFGGFGHAISNGSFSKIAGPGLRTGWVEASPAFVAGLSRTASTLSGGAPSQFCAAILGDLVRNGQLEAHIDNVMRPSLQRRHRLMMDAIRKYISPLGIRARESSLEGKQVYGGYFIWLTANRGQLPAASVIADAALREENLAIGPGNMFEVSGDERDSQFDQAIRLCFAWQPEYTLVEGVRKLASLLERMQCNMEKYQQATKLREDAFRDAYKYTGYDTYE